MPKPGDCDFYGDHKAIDERLRHHGEEIQRLRDNQGELFSLVRDVTKEVRDVAAGVARIEGSLAGALAAKKLSWPVILALLSIGGAGLVAALVHLARGS